MYLSAGRDGRFVAAQAPFPDSPATTVSENCALLALFHYATTVQHNFAIAKDPEVEIIIYTSS